MADRKPVGAAWKATSKDGKKSYMNITIDGKKYVMFKNGFKKGEKEPDFVIYDSISTSTGRKAVKAQPSQDEDEFGF